jgi:hypothetical protein
VGLRRRTGAATLDRAAERHDQRQPPAAPVRRRPPPRCGVRVTRPDPHHRSGRGGVGCRTRTPARDQPAHRATSHRHRPPHRHGPHHVTTASRPRPPSSRRTETRGSALTPPRSAWERYRSGAVRGIPWTAGILLDGPVRSPVRAICTVTDGGGTYHLAVTSAATHNFGVCTGWPRFPGTLDDLFAVPGMDRRCLSGNDFAVSDGALVGVYSGSGRADLAAAQRFCASRGWSND